MEATPQAVQRTEGAATDTPVQDLVGQKEGHVTASQRIPAEVVDQRKQQEKLQAPLQILGGEGDQATSESELPLSSQPDNNLPASPAPAQEAQAVTTKDSPTEQEDPAITGKDSPTMNQSKQPSAGEPSLDTGLEKAAAAQAHAAFLSAEAEACSDNDGPPGFYAQIHSQDRADGPRQVAQLTAFVG